MSELPPSGESHSPDPSFDVLRPLAAREPAPREGLPATFRMRADAHYVDWLDASPPPARMEVIAVGRIERRDGAQPEPPAALVESIRRYGVLQPLIVQSRQGRLRVVSGHKRLAAATAAGLREVPCLVRDVDDESADRIAAAANVFAAVSEAESAKPADDSTSADAGIELARSLANLQRSASLLTDPASEFTYGVGTNLMRAEIWRATCLLQSVRFLRGELPVARRRLAVQPLVGRVLQVVEPERRLRGVGLNRQLTLSHSRIQGDEELLVCALSSLVSATFGLVDGADAQVTVLARLDPGGDFVFSVAQDTVTAPVSWTALGREEPRGGAGTALVALATARQIVESCEGRLNVTASGGGSEIQVTIPSVP